MAPVGSCARQKITCSPGEYSTCPKEIDGIIRRAWGMIYRGNIQDTHRAAARFVAKYSEYIYKEKEMEWESEEDEWEEDPTFKRECSF